MLTSFRASCAKLNTKRQRTTLNWTLLFSREDFFLPANSRWEQHLLQPNAKYEKNFLQIVKFDGKEKENILTQEPLISKSFSASADWASRFLLIFEFRGILEEVDGVLIGG